MAYTPGCSGRGSAVGPPAVSGRGQVTVVLDTGPLGLLVQRSGLAPADECRAWLRSLLSSGHDACVPEICDYELRRELLRLGLNQAIDRLAQIEATLEYLPI